LGSLLFATVLAFGVPARAADFSLKLEPGMALAVTDPQSQRFSAGGGVALKGAWSALRFIDLQATFLFIGLPAVQANDSTGLAYGLGGGVRVQRPHAAGQFFPWVDGDALYVRTGALNRFGFTVALGVSFPIGAERRVWIGPFLRYFQIVDPSHDGFDVSDAKIATVGLSGEYGPSRRLAPPPPVDHDGDGIPDDKDKCPDKPEDIDGFHDHDGCPDPDNDKDGIPDEKDKCPNQAEDKDGFEDADGCPDLDDDKDGVSDDKDKCPKQAEDRDGFEDGDGCPDADNDNDGIPDAEDRCPQLPGVASAKGCPDRDGDGVADDEDLCPDAAGPADALGCKKPAHLTITKTKIEPSERIQFARDASKIAPKSLPILDEVAQLLKDARELRLRIEGYSDDKGGAARAMPLSQGRAEAVRSYLISKGVPPERVSAKGFGAEKPIDNNATPAGRENNQRVELMIDRGEAAK
jgi:outer membrane protein OmpA-like peptidoglycan-associated protein